MIKPEVLDALVAAGCTAEQIAAAVKADQARASGAARQARYRERLKASRVTHSDVTERNETSHSPSPNDDLNPIPKEKAPYGGQKESPSEPDLTDAALAEFNRVAGLVAWPKAQKLTNDRRAKLRQRLKEADGLAGWTAALERAARSPMLTGDNNRGWRASLDFFLQASSFLKLTEGNYDDKRSRPHAELIVAPQEQERSWSSMLTAWKRGSWSSYWGPEPKQPGCKIPSEFVSQWATSPSPHQKAVAA